MPEAMPKLHGRPEFWAEQTPDAAAVVDGERTLTYAEWNDAADRLADALAARLPDASSCAVVLHQRLEWFVINLALAKLGWEHVAISWQISPDARLAEVRSGAPDVVFVDSADDVAALAAEPVLVVGVALEAADGATDLATLLADPPRERRRSARPAPFIKYTSGTTGTAKRVRRPVPRDAETRKALIETTVGPMMMFRATHDQDEPFHNRTLSTKPLHHGSGPRGARVCHTEGGTVYLLDHYDPLRALEIIHRHRITHWNSVPTMLHRMRALGDEQLARYDVSSMRMLAVGSAPVPMVLKEWALDYFGECLFEGYGASEIGHVSLMPPHLHRSHPGSCGLLRPHVEVRIVDPAGNEVPPGEEGELLVRTPLTIGGYDGDGSDDEAHDDDDEAEDRPAAQVTEDGFFHSGDLGRLDAEGFLYITGRAKDIVIRGGVNIAPRAIEDTLMEHPGLLEVAVIGVPDEEFGEALAAFCEPRPGTQVTEQEVREFAATRLPSFQRPRDVHIVANLPRNSMGKIVKGELNVDRE